MAGFWVHPRQHRYLVTAPWMRAGVLRFLWDGYSWCPTLGMGSPLLPQTLVMLEPQHCDLLAQRCAQPEVWVILDLHLCKGFYSAPSPVDAVLGHGGCWRWRPSPQNEPIHLHQQDAAAGD